MLLSFDKNHNTKNLSYQLITSRDIAEQRILQSDWTQGAPGLTQPTALYLDLHPFKDYLQAKN